MSNLIDSNLHVTITVHVSIFPAAVAVIIAVPGATAVTFPFSFTVATDSSLDDHVTVLLSVVSSGVTTAFNVSEEPFSIVKLALSIVTSSNSTTGTSTVIVSFLLFTDVAVIVAVPGAIALTTPLTTVATSSFDDSHLIVFDSAKTSG